MGSANSTQQNIPQSTQGTTMNIECTLVESHLKEMARLKSELEETTAKNLSLERSLKESEENRNSLQNIYDKNVDEMIKNISLFNGSELQRKKSEEIVRSLRRNNESLTKQNGSLQMQVRESESRVNEIREKLEQITRELQSSSDKYNDNNKTWNTKYNKLNSQYSKLQSELQRYKSHKALVHFVELQPQLQKLTSQIDSTVKKFTKQSQNKTRPISESELEMMRSVYVQNATMLAIFNPTLAEKFTVAFKAYKDLCETNDKKILDVMKSLFDLEKNTKALNENLHSEIFKVTQKAKTSVEKYTKEIAELKQKSFGNDFKQEEKLGTDLLQAFNEIKITSNSVPNNLNTSVPIPSISKTGDKLPFVNIPRSTTTNSNGKKGQNKNEDLQKPNETGWNFNLLDEKNKNYNVIVYDFPENLLTGVEHEAVDLINIKYFLGKLDLGDVKNMKVQRLPTTNNNRPRPVVINLPNEETVIKVLTCPHKLAEMGLHNIKIARFNGKI